MQKQKELATHNPRDVAIHFVHEQHSRRMLDGLIRPLTRLVLFVGIVLDVCDVLCEPLHASCEKKTLVETIKRQKKQQVSS